MDNLIIDPAVTEAEPELQIDAVDDTQFAPTDDPKSAAVKASKVAFSYDDDPEIEARLAQGFTTSRTFEAEERDRKAFAQSLNVENMRQNTIRDYLTYIRDNGVDAQDSDLEAIKQLSEADLTSLQHDPQTVFERAFARKVINSSLEAPSSFERGVAEPDMPEGAWERSPEATKAQPQITDILGQALSEDQQKALDMMDASERHVLKSEIVNTTLKNFVKKREDLGYARKGFEYFRNMAIPFYWWGSSQDALGEASADAFWPGNNRAEQIAYWWSIDDPKVAHDELNKAVESIAAWDPVAAMNFLEAVAGYSFSSQTMDNVFGGLDVASILPVGAIAKGFGPARAAGKATGSLGKGIGAGIQAGLPATTALATKLKSVLINSSAFVKGWKGPAALKAASGTTAARARATHDAIKNELMRRAGITNMERDMDEVMNTASSIFDPFKATTGYTGHLKPEDVNRITDNLVDTAGSTLKAMENLVQIDRLSDEALGEALANTRKRYTDLYPGISNQIVDMQHINPTDGVSNNNFFKIIIGNKEGDAFESEQQAKVFAEMAGLPADVKASQETVAGQQMGWHLVAVRSVDETAPSVMDKMSTIGRNQTPDLVTNVFFGLLKSKDAKVSASLADDAAVSVYGRGKVVKFLEKQASAIVNLNKKQRGKLQRFIELQRTTKNGDNVGVDSDTLMDLEKDWDRLFGERIDAATAQAYLNFKQMKDAFWWHMNDMEFKQKSRLGIENYSIPVPHDKQATRSMDGSGIIPQLNKKYTKDTIEGKIIKEIPWDSPQDTGIVRIHKDTGTIDVWRKQDVTGGTKDAINFEAGTGEYQIIHVSPHGREALNKILGEDAPKYVVSYLIVPKPKSSRLKYLQLPYKEGFRIESLGKHFVSQPVIQTTAGRAGTKNNLYVGDRNLLNFNHAEEAKKWIPHINKARELLKEIPKKGAIFTSPQYKAFADFVHATLPYGDREFYDMFRGPKRAFSEDHAFMLRRKDSSLAKDHKLEDIYTNFTNDLDNEHNLYAGNVDLEFSRERNKLIQTIQSDGNGYMGFADGSLVDPWTIYEKQATRIGNDVFADDLKLKHAAMIVKEFADILDGTREEILRNPYKHIVAGKIRPTADPRQRAAFNGARRSLMEIVGTQSEFSREVERMKRRLVDNVVMLVNAKWGQKKADLTENIFNWTLERDPARLLRGIGLHSKIGMFNPLQWVMQAQGIAHTAMRVGPADAYRAAGASWLMKALFINPDHVVDFAGRATKMGWKASDFRESYSALVKSGFFNVDHSYGILTEAVAPKMIRSKTKSFASSTSLLPFKHGEFVNRIMAWNAAYLRWKKQNPGRYLINDEDIARVLKTADSFTLNMSSASSAQWEKGWLGVPTQFFSYQARLMEQMLGGRITGAERLRLFAGYSILYGLPIGLTGTTFGGIWPASKDISAYLIDNGVDVDENIVNKLLMRGVFDVTVNGLLTDKDYNFSTRYGPSGNPFIRDLYMGDTSLFETLTGASGRIVGGDSASNGILADTFGVGYTMVAAAFSPQDDFYPLTSQRLHEAMSNISTYNNVWKAWAAYNYGRWYSKKGTYLDGDVDQWDAIIGGISGTMPQELENGFIMAENTKQRKEYMKYIGKEVKKLLQLATAPNTADDDRAAYYAKINDYLFKESGATPTEVKEIMQSSMKELPSAMDTMERAYMAEGSDKADMILNKYRRKREEVQQ